jgi:LysM repeat protein
VDLDYFNGTLAELSQLAGGNLPAATPAVDDKLTSIPIPPVTNPTPTGTTSGAGKKSPAPNPSTYTVVANDNLTIIAQRFRVSLDALKAANPMDDFNLIFIGQVLNIPPRE